MTRLEARTILDIMSSADGGCSICVDNLYTQFIEEFPEFLADAKELFKKHIGMSWNTNGLEEKD